MTLRTPATVNNINLSHPAKKRRGQTRRKDRPVSRFAPTTVPKGFAVAQKAIKRLQVTYPTELELRPVQFNGRDTRVKNRLQVYGAARSKFERFMDRQSYWDWSWMSEAGSEEEFKTRPPFRDRRYPLSVFQGRKKVENDRKQCEREGCGLWFAPSRKGQKFHDKACKQMAYRRREGTKGTSSALRINVGFSTKHGPPLGGWLYEPGTPFQLGLEIIEVAAAA